MTQDLHKSFPNPGQPKPRPTTILRFLNWKRFLIPRAGLALAGPLVSCSGGGAPPKLPPVPVPVTDTRPVGEGLKIIGFAVLGAAVVTVLGKLIR